jgi:RimJ/RimL family protein N-acetyltransferase
MRNRKTNSLSNPYLIGKHVYLRAVEKDDAAVIQKWHNDPDVRRLSRSGGLSVSRVAEEEEIATASAVHDVYLMIAQTANNKPIGFIRPKVTDTTSRNVWLRFVIGEKSAQGRGYAHEALMLTLDWLFNEQNMHKVTLETYATNKRALRFFEKIGFKKEGVLRDALYQDGTYHDIISFGLLASEFRRA